MARRRGGDKLFKKAKKDFKREKANKESVKSIIIACEDSVSAPTYLQKIIDKLLGTKSITPNSVIIVPHDGSTNPTNILKNLKKYQDVAYSNDSFELWYLLHFYYRDTSIMRDKIIDEVIKKLKDLEPHKFARLTKENFKGESYTKQNLPAIAEVKYYMQKYTTK